MVTLRKRPKLDRIFRNMLSLLQTHGRMSNADLADAVNLSPSPCLERMRKLEEDGLVRGYIAELDISVLAPDHVHMIVEVTLGDHSKEDFRAFQQCIQDVREIVSCYKIAGPFDYTMDIFCRDLPHFDQVIDRIKSAGAPISVLRHHQVEEKTRIFSGYPLDRLLQD